MFRGILEVRTCHDCLSRTKVNMLPEAQWHSFRLRDLWDNRWGGKASGLPSCIDGLSIDVPVCLFALKFKSILCCISNIAWSIVLEIFRGVFVCEQDTIFGIHTVCQ